MLYVDDIIMIRNDKLEIENLKQPLVIEFRIKDLRALRYFIELRFQGHEEGHFYHKGVRFYF